MSRKDEERRKRTEAALVDWAARMTRALNTFAEEGRPHWQRMRDGMACLKGARLSDMPLPLQDHIDASLSAVNDILAGYKIETWEDYQQITPADFARIQLVFLNLALNP